MQKKNNPQLNQSRIGCAEPETEQRHIIWYVLTEAGAGVAGTFHSELELDTKPESQAEPYNFSRLLIAVAFV